MTKNRVPHTEGDDRLILGIGEELLASQLLLRELGHENKRTLQDARDTLFAGYSCLYEARELHKKGDTAKAWEEQRKEVAEFEADVTKIAKLAVGRAR